MLETIWLSVTAAPRVGRHFSEGISPQCWFDIQTIFFLLIVEHFVPLQAVNKVYNLCNLVLFITSLPYSSNCVWYLFCLYLPHPVSFSLHLLHYSLFSPLPIWTCTTTYLQTPCFSPLVLPSLCLSLLHSLPFPNPCIFSHLDTLNILHLSIQSYPLPRPCLFLIPAYLAHRI